MRIPTGLNGMSPGFPRAAGGRLSRLADFGTNPGALAGWVYAPPDLADKAPLVVVLHGCTQDAAGYDRGSGWSRLAESCGFAVLFPEQARANNANTCFNWFQPDDIRRDSGEALSIRQMIETSAQRHRTDRSRIFVTGLSAGGAMAMTMLAAYPEIFAGGAIVAGLPYGTAASVPEAFARMRGQGALSPADLTAAVRRASPHKGTWPSLSVWQGSTDQTVAPSNAEAIVAQWRGLHALADGTARLEAIGPHARKVWSDARGRDVIESWTIAGMGHGTPIDGRRDGIGEAGPFMLEAGISSTREIARFWGIATAAQLSARAPAASQASPATVPAASNAIETTIHDALRKAGLMR